MYKRNTEARLCNHYCHGKAMSITYSEFVFLAFVIQHAMHMYICGLSGCTINVHIIL